MTALNITVRGPSEQWQHEVNLGADGIWFGRDDDCTVVLPSELVSRRHLRVRRTGSTLVIEDRSSNGTWFDGTCLRAGVHHAQSPATLAIGPYAVTLEYRADAHEAAQQREATTASSQNLRREMRRQLLEHIDLQRLDARKVTPEHLREDVRGALRTMYRKLMRQEFEPSADGDLIEELCDEALGLGPLEALLQNDDVSEIMVVDPSTVYVERGGCLQRANIRFTDSDAVRSVLERIVTPLGRRIDESSPMVDARLADGSRVNAVIPPLATRGPCITIRKFGKTSLSFDDFVRWGSLTQEAADFLQATVRARRNLVISGGTGSGKTTLLNVLSSAIPATERIVTVEDAAELQLQQDHVVTLEARPPNLEGRGEVSIRDLVKNALRMRPDRILVGECRGAEALDMLQAMNTGHDGSMTTTHANSPGEALSRLETLCLMAGLNLPDSAVRRQLAQSVHLIVQQTRLADGSRKVTAVTELCGVDESGAVITHDIFRFVRGSDGSPGRLRATGYLPTFAAALDTGGAP